MNYTLCGYKVSDEAALRMLESCYSVQCRFGRAGSINSEAVELFREITELKRKIKQGEGKCQEV